MLMCCANSLGAGVSKSYAELVEEQEQTRTAARTTTLAEAQAAWEKTLEDSRRWAEEDGGEGP